MILILAAFAIALYITVFLDKKTIRRLYVLIVGVFLLSIVVFVEFYLSPYVEYRALRTVLIAIRYSSPPFIIAQIIYALVKKQQWYVFIPAMVLAVINIVSIFTGVVFSIGEDNVFVRGPLGYLPFIMAGGYCVFLIILLFRRSNRQRTEIITIIFFSASFVLDLVFPFIFGSDFSLIFCPTIAVALFVYYVFSILELTKKDSLTGLLNRQAYIADVCKEPAEITGLLSIDMNGLKSINDNQGHLAGDDALVTLALCFMRASGSGKACYRVGGDEFMIVCRRTSHDELLKLIERIKSLVAETKYSCSVGYSYNEDGKKSVDEMSREAEKQMYIEKERYYEASGEERRER